MKNHIELVQAEVEAMSGVNFSEPIKAWLVWVNKYIEKTILFHYSLRGS